MKRFAFVSLIFLAACAGPVPIRFSAHAKPAPVVGISNPSFMDGDVARGRRAFIEMRCIDCHRVAEDPTLPLGARAVAGPVLENMQRYSSAKVAERITSRRTGENEDLFDRRMKDYAQPMTSQQLVDIVAYLRSFGTAGRG